MSQIPLSKKTLAVNHLLTPPQMESQGYREQESFHWFHHDQMIAEPMMILACWEVPKTTFPSINDFEAPHPI